MEEEGFSKATAVIACTAMALLYVAILYAPTLILRLPPPPSLKSFLIRRFLCASISSIVSLLVCALILPGRSREASILFGVYGIRVDHIAGSLVLKSVSLADSRRQNLNDGEDFSFEGAKSVVQEFLDSIISVASNVLAWRNYVVAPVTEELVFRACMIPLLLCGGFKPYTVIYICPIFFSLAHLNHLMEFYSKQNYSLVKTAVVVGLQLGYTVIFGSYASFLFIRTGHLLAPLVAHIFCNFMGLPVLFSRRKGIVSVAFVAGAVGFILLIFTMTRPELYNYRVDNCKCWHGYCSWS